MRSEPKVIVGEGAGRTRGPSAPAAGAGWRLVGWLGLALAVAGLGDLALAWYPPSFGTPEWEFATVAVTFSGLPLVTMGVVGLLASGVALGKRWLVAGGASLMLVLALMLVAAYVLFLTNVPMALRAAEGMAQVGIKKAIAKTSLLGITFAVVYFAGAVTGFRRLRRQREG